MIPKRAGTDAPFSLHLSGSLKICTIQDGNNPHVLAASTISHIRTHTISTHDATHPLIACGLASPQFKASIRKDASEANKALRRPNQDKSAVECILASHVLLIHLFVIRAQRCVHFPSILIDSSHEKRHNEGVAKPGT